MRSRDRVRVGVAAGAIGCLLAVAAGCGGEDEATPPSTPPETAVVTTAPTPTETTAPAPEPEPAQQVTVKIVVNDGRAVGGIVRPRVEQGQRLTLVVTSDVADHVHLHGYDKMVDVGPGRPAKLPFTATIPGRFEVELEDSGVQIAEIEVRP